MARTQIDPEKKPNGTKAAIEAGFAEKSAGVAASRMLKNDKILSAIEEKVKELNEKLDNSSVASAQEVLEFMTRAQRFKQTENWTESGSMKAVAEIEKNADLIESIKVTTKPDGTVTQEIKTVSKSKTVELLAKHHKLLTDVVEQTGPPPTIKPVFLVKKPNKES